MAEFNQIMAEEIDTEDTFMDNYIKNYTEKIKNGEFNSTAVCTALGK